ncbi:hypothetical protein N7468_009232 [Penicillium chermesinum]|uniref:Glycosyl transferase CAP10 domain-containing protein n=1 Tax=Penicillium chermesinum TaxID=63820 RepID=A0A9W9NJZ3_9EURO|nr:uncharacterized protein N7468_009232 [Penicillium chermesinum]KAJ5220028.1 hypothetical protein N7468_009232 [Penicillium chermesinum]KAJ6157481.1 hypothetical protein N7470_005073 [Penicillium chermesinum]
MSPIVRHIRLSLLNIVEALRSGAGQQNYRLLKGVPEGSRRQWTTLGIATAALLFIWYVMSGSPLPATFNRTFVAYHDELCEHPVVRLHKDALLAFNETLKRQSTSLPEAEAEYRRRYNMPPPPHFDKWYDFAKERNTVLIDEFDTIYHTLLPFWGLSPAIIRSRIREDLGANNFAMGITIRDGRPTDFGEQQGGFQRNATIKQLGMIAQWLPDLDLQFNAHDEPRVVVSHEDLHRLITAGRASQTRLNENSSLSNAFSGNRLEPIAEVFKSRFNNIERQETWLVAKQSCPPDSPVRSLEGNAPDNSSAFAIEPLGFISNQTAASDLCNNPSLRHRLGVFKKPNSFKVTNELTPMFSMSHPSSFQDVAVPSPFYYEGISAFDETASVPWDSKKGQVYWRGATTGGHSFHDSWRGLLRQQIVGNLTQPESPRYTLEKKENSACKIGTEEGWEVREANEAEIREYFNTYFVDIQDCDDDCPAEEAYFQVVDHDDQNEAWKYKYLLDMDGHAYSGRFYALLRSKSVPLKVTFFREWHENVLFPWVHYVPLNKDAQEIPEIIRFFENDPAGQEIAKRIGAEGQSWAAKAIRNDDMDVYMFRLMLEYVLSVTKLQTH